MESDISVQEYYSLLVGILMDTPLGEVVRVRSETDPKTIQKMTQQEKNIRAEWWKFRADHPLQRGSQQCDISLNGFKDLLLSMAKGG